MKNLSNYITERLVISKTKNAIDDLSDVDLGSYQCIIRLGEFYRWYWGVATFKDLKKNNLTDFEYCCGNMKGEFKGSPEELIDYLFKFVKSGEDYAVCTIIPSPHDWEFEIHFKGIEFNETSVDPLPKAVIHRLPDNLSNTIELSESVFNERLVISKNKEIPEFTIFEPESFLEEYKRIRREYLKEYKPLSKLKDINGEKKYIVFEESTGSKAFKSYIIKLLIPYGNYGRYTAYKLWSVFTNGTNEKVNIRKEYERGKVVEIFPRKSKYNQIERTAIFCVDDDDLFANFILDSYNKKFEIKENQISERLVISKTRGKYPLTYDKIDVENDIDIEFVVGDPGSYNDSLLAGYIQYGDKFDNIGVFVLKDVDTCNICFLDSKVKLTHDISYYTSHVNMHDDIEGKCETSNWLLGHFVSSCSHCKPLSLNVYTNDLEITDFLEAISTSIDDYADHVREDIIFMINELFDTTYTADDIRVD